MTLLAERAGRCDGLRLQARKSIPLEVGSYFILAYPATRESANRIDIKITITPVAKASRSANTRRIETSLDEAIAFRMVFRHRHAHLAEGFFNCIHHHSGPADEVLMIGIRWRQMTLEHLGVDETLFTRPAGRGVRQHMNDRQVEPRFQHLQLLAEGNRFPVLAAIEQNHGPLVAVVSERTDHTHHRRNTDTARDQHVHVRRVANRERAVRSIEVDTLAHGHSLYLLSEVTQIPDRHLDAAPLRRGAGRE